jgi:hypothetical protein
MTVRVDVAGLMPTTDGRAAWRPVRVRVRPDQHRTGDRVIANVVAAQRLLWRYRHHVDRFCLRHRKFDPRPGSLIEQSGF